MRKYILLVFLLFPLAILSQSIYRCQNGHIQFYSNAAQELIKANSNKLSGVINSSKKTFAFLVKISSFDGFNSPLQREHFNEKYLESVKYPVAEFSGKFIEDIDFTKDGIYEIRAKGIFKIHNVEQERIIKGTITVVKNVIFIKSDFNVILKDHNIKVPKVVHEKIASEINLSVALELVEEKVIDQ